MAHIKTEKEYAAIMVRIDQLFFETDEDTSSPLPLHNAAIIFLSVGVDASATRCRNADPNRTTLLH